MYLKLSIRNARRLAFDYITGPVYPIYSFNGYAHLH